MAEGAVSSLALKWFAVQQWRLGWAVASILGTLLVAWLGVTINQSLAILFSAVVLTIWAHNKSYGLIAALLFFIAKPVFVRMAYAIDRLFSGVSEFDLLGMAPALLLAGLIVWHLYLRISVGEKILVGRTRLWLLLFSAIAFLSIFNPSNSILVGLGGFERNILPNMLILFLAADIFKSEREIRILLYVLLWVGIVSVLYGLGQYIVGIFPWETRWFQEIGFSQNTSGWLTIGLRGIEFRIFSIFYYRTDFYFTNVLIFTLLYASNMFSAGPARGLKYFYYFIWLAMMVVTFERTPFIMTLLAAAIVFLFQATPRRRKIFVAVAATLFIGSYSVLTLGKSYLENSGVASLIRLAELTNPLQAESIVDRTDNFWGPSLTLIKENPMGIGIGQGSGTKASGLVSLSDSGNIRSHNELLQKTLETGIPGAIVFVILLISVFRDSWRLRKLSSDLNWIGTGMVSATLVFWLGSMITLTFSESRGLVYWAMAGIVLALIDQNSPKECGSPQLCEHKKVGN